MNKTSKFLAILAIPVRLEQRLALRAVVGLLAGF